MPSTAATTAPVSGTNLLAARPTDLKFAYNLVAWATVPTGSGTVRRSTATPENIGSQLGTKWATVIPNTLNTGYGSGAAVYKGAIFYVDGAGVLHAYNANPGSV